MRLSILICFLASQITLVDARDLLDPTQPQRTHKLKKMHSAVKPSLVLNAIFINGQSRYAVINGKQYQVEDLVQGNKLTVISQNHVTLNTTSGEQKKLFMNSHNIKKDINNVF